MPQTVLALAAFLSLALMPAAQDQAPVAPAERLEAPAPRPEGGGLLPTQDWIGQEGDPKKVATTVEVVLLVTILSLAPAILMLVTSFTRIAVVLAFVRRALGTPDVPPNQVVMGLSILLTVVVMAPVGAEVKREAWDPWKAGTVTQREAVERAVVPLRDFMLRHARPEDLTLFMELSHQPEREGGWTEADVPTEVLLPAFVISELRRAFVMGFALLLPFLVIDLLIAAVLTSMGMFMLPPVLVALPFKLLLFVLVDGWALIAGSLVASYGGTP